MKKSIATVLVLGGMSLGSNIFASDAIKNATPRIDEKKVHDTEREAALQSTIQRFYDELKSEMNKQPTKKQDPIKKSANNPNEPEQMGRMALGVINGQLKDDENKVAASVNAKVVVNNGQLENMVVSAHAGSANVAMSIDAKTGRSTTNLSYADKKGSRVDVTLRDYKDPVVRITVPLKFIKGVNFAGVYDSKTDYTSANIGVNHKGMSANVCYEIISDQARTTMRIGYSPNFKFPVKGSITRTTYRNQEYYSIDGQSKLGPVDVLVSARKNGNGKYDLVAQARCKFSF
jgi:hypothetical protein